MNEIPDRLEKLAQSMREWPSWWPWVAILVFFLLVCGGVRCEMGINVDSKPSEQVQQAEQP